MSYMTLLTQLVSAPAVRRQPGGLAFAPEGFFAAALGDGELRELATELRRELLLLQEDENDTASLGLADDQATAVFFATHCYGDPGSWGWQRGAGTLRRVMPESLASPECHLPWDCEPSLLLLGALDPVSEQIERIEGDPSMCALGLRALRSVVDLCIGTSAHSGDFLWMSDHLGARTRAGTHRRTLIR